MYKIFCRIQKSFSLVLTIFVFSLFQLSAQVKATSNDDNSAKDFFLKGQMAKTPRGDWIVNVFIFNESKKSIFVDFLSKPSFVFDSSSSNFFMDLSSRPFDDIDLFSLPKMVKIGPHSKKSYSFKIPKDIAANIKVDSTSQFQIAMVFFLKKDYLFLVKCSCSNTYLGQEFIRRQKVLKLIKELKG